MTFIRKWWFTHCVLVLTPEDSLCYLRLLSKLQLLFFDKHARKSFIHKLIFLSHRWISLMCLLNLEVFIPMMACMNALLTRTTAPRNAAMHSCRCCVGVRWRCFLVVILPALVLSTSGV